MLNVDNLSGPFEILMETYISSSIQSSTCWCNYTELYPKGVGAKGFKKKRGFKSPFPSVKHMPCNERKGVRMLLLEGIGPSMSHCHWIPPPS